MTDREILRRLADHLTRVANAADFMACDAICYGGPIEDHRDVREEALKALRVIPKNVRAEFDAEDRKAKADALRAKADAIEQGTA